MSTIQNTVQSALSDNGLGQYASHAEPVVAALQEREDAIVQALREVASSKGLGSHETDILLETVGLIEPTPEPEPASDNGDLAAQVERLARQVNALITAAGRHGVRV